MSMEFKSHIFGCQGPLAPLAFFIHGWPDDSSIFSDQIGELSRTHRCVAVESPLNGPIAGPSVIGPSFLDLYQGFDKLVESYRKPQEKVVLVAHDWGTMIALDYERRFGKSRVSKMVILDVFAEPPQPNRKPSWKLLLLVFVYQSWLITALLIHHFVPFVGRWIGDTMTWLCAFVFNAPGARSRKKRFSAVQNFYYLQFWRGMISPYKSLFPSHSRQNGGPRLPEVPLLFIWGSKKPVQFFDDNLLPEISKRTDGSRHVSVPSGHWVTRNANTTREIVQFFTEN